MPWDPKLLLPLALVVAGILLFHSDPFIEDLPLRARVSCQFGSFFCLIIGIGWLYTSVHNDPKRAVLKILDWALIGFMLCMMPVFDLLRLEPFYFLPFMIALLAGRLFVSWYLKKDSWQLFDLALFFTVLSIAMAFGGFGLLGFVSTRTGYTTWSLMPLVAVAICLAVARLIIALWIKRKKVEGEV